MSREACDGTGEAETCCMCHRPAREYYDGREDSPYCGRFLCGVKIQAMIDYHEERGG